MLCVRRADINAIPTDHNYTIPSTSAGAPATLASTVLSDFARKRKAASLAVPTDDKRVRAELRARGEPITLFGERPEDRRDRLRELIYQGQEGGYGEDEDGRVAKRSRVDIEEDGEEDEEGEFYTEGSEALLEARKAMARYSMPRATKRIAHQRLESAIPVQTHVKHRPVQRVNLITSYWRG